MSQPVVSVVIPTYNRAQALTRSAGSVLHQSWGDFELIIVDDGSKDNTKEIVSLIKAEDDRVRYIGLKQNTNGAVARNVGIQHARGAYVAFLDSDDEWMPHHLERKMSILKKSGKDGVYGSFIVNGPLDSFELACTAKHDNVNMAEYILSGEGDTRTSTFLCRKQAVGRVRFDELLEKHQDWDFAIRFGGLYDWVVDEEPTIVINAQGQDRMSATVNHVATKRFIEKYAGMLSFETLTKFHTSLAQGTLATEGHNLQFENYLNKAHFYKGKVDSLSRSTVIRLSLLSIPVIRIVFVRSRPYLGRLKRMGSSLLRVTAG